ncbi:hypothetical protein O181_043155 [Austropuccinia psidii MF-1]|uniref:Reverse transcriptase RNase H-like domain-containing protein n=1 Tax=Austropuccinia psidii MF-1 TaxID=1389203 RepID=A0A9Q3HIV9_9BASI|nr:hypothetical protein [Austropuccinia psidii MF-1]
MKFLFLVWELNKLHYYLDGSVFEVINDCNALKLPMNMKTTNRNIMRWQIDIQEYRGNINIFYEAGNIHRKADGLSRWKLANTCDKPAYVPLEAEPQFQIEGINRTDIVTSLFEEKRD